VLGSITGCLQCSFVSITASVELRQRASVSPCREANINKLVASGRGLHSFTLELNLSNSRTYS